MADKKSESKPASKKEEMAEFSQNLAKTIQSYLSPDSIKKSLSTAFVRQESGMLKLQSTDVMQDGDVVSFDLVESTKQPMSMKVEEGPMQCQKSRSRFYLDGTPFLAREPLPMITPMGGCRSISIETLSSPNTW